VLVKGGRIRAPRDATQLSARRFFSPLQPGQQQIQPVQQQNACEIAILKQQLNTAKNEARRKTGAANSEIPFVVQNKNHSDTGICGLGIERSETTYSKRISRRERNLSIAGTWSPIMTQEWLSSDNCASKKQK
jgi:hypothetical protein